MKFRLVLLDLINIDLIVCTSTESNDDASIHNLTENEKKKKLKRLLQ